METVCNFRAGPMPFWFVGGGYIVLSCARARTRARALSLCEEDSCVLSSPSPDPHVRHLETDAGADADDSEEEQDEEGGVGWEGGEVGRLKKVTLNQKVEGVDSEG